MANCDNDRRVLDVYYTGKGTKLFVENGVLVEQSIKSSSPSSSSHLGIHGGMERYPSPTFLPPFEMPFSSGESCKSYSYDPPQKEPPLSEEEKTRVAKLINEQTTMLAKTALAYYNRRNHTKHKYELVDPLISNGIMGNGISYHCNFTATNAISPESSQQGPKLFFAELKVVHLKSDRYKYFVTACRPIDGAKAVTGCVKCKDIIQHPSHGFRQGLHHFNPRTLRPRWDGKVARKF